MNALLESWLTELRDTPTMFPQENGGGATENMWSISWGSDKPIDPNDFIAFLKQAAQIRQGLAMDQGVNPCTFYAWHDVQAGQLRFSTARCTEESLPFGATVVLAQSPDEIVHDFLGSSHRDGIPLEELEDLPDDDDQPLVKKWKVRVWAERLL